MARNAQVEAAFSGYAEAWQIYGEANPGEFLLEPGAAAMALEGPPTPMLNQGMCHGGDLDGAAPIRSLLAFYEPRGVPFLLSVPEDAGKAIAACEEAGLATMASVPFMVLDAGDGGSLPDAPEGIRIAQVTTVEELTAHQETMAAGFGMPVSMSSAFSNATALGHDRFAMFNAYDGDACVATAVATLGVAATGIWCVATREEARRRGIGAAVTATAVRAGIARGVPLTFLQASDSGRPVYERMGYRTAMQCIWYTRPAN